MSSSAAVVLRSKEGHSLTLSVDAAVCTSQLIRETLLDDHGHSHSFGLGPDNHIVIDLGRFSFSSLELIVEFMQHYHSEPMLHIATPLRYGSLDKLVPQLWYRNFVQTLDATMTFQLIAVANFLDIQPLLDLLTLSVSLNLKGMSAEHIRQYLRLPKLSPEEEQKAKREFPWLGFNV